MPTKPAEYVDWTDNAPTKVQKPPASQLLSGFTAGQPPPFQWFNWLFQRLGAWVRYLDESLQSVAPNAGSLVNARLIGGGNWSFGAGTGTLAWSAPAYVAFPGQQDGYNTIAAGSVTLLDGHVAYASASFPFRTTGTTTSGSNQITDVAYVGSVVVGQSVLATGVPAGTTVTAISGNTVVLSANATATATGVQLTFSASATLTLLTGPENAVQATSTTLIIARRVGSTVVVGVGAGEMVLRDGELKPLRGTGYMVHNAALTAGSTMAVGTPVYISPGGESGRSAGLVYPVEASSTAGVRSAMLGVLSSAASGGGTAQVVTGGVVSGFSGLTAGVAYYVSPTTPGAVTDVRPTGAGQYVINVGVALSSTQMLVNASGPAANTQVQTGAGQGNYGVTNETQLAAALTACATNGGGVVVVQGGFTLSSQYTVPANTLLLGGMGGSPLTVLAGGGLVLAFGARLQELYMQTSLTSGTMLSITGSAVGVRDCRFTIPSSSTGACVSVTGSGTRLIWCTFVGVAAGTAIGINYVSGSDNLDDSSVFM